MANRFDQPAQAQFVNTYVPIPFEELSQAAMMRQGKHEQGLQMLDEAEAAAMAIKAIPNPNQIAIRDNIVQGIEGLTGKYAQEDLSDPEVVRALKAEMRKVAPKDVISNLESNYGMWEQTQKEKRALYKENRFNPMLDDDPAKDPTWGAAGESYDYIPRAYDPKEKTLMPYMGMLENLTVKGIDPNTGAVMMGRDQSDLNRVIGEYASEYSATPGGQDEIRLFKQLHPEAAEGMSDVEIAAQIMNDFGQQFIREDIKYGGGGSGRGGGIEGLLAEFDTQPPMALTGAEVERTGVREAEREIEGLNQQIRQAEQAGGNTSQLRNQRNEIQAVLDQATEKSKVWFDEEFSTLQDQTKAGVASLDFLSGKQKSNVEGAFNRLLEKHKVDPLGNEPVVGNISSLGRPPAQTQDAYPGLSELQDIMKEEGLSTRERRKVSTFYENFFGETLSKRAEARRMYEEDVMQNLSKASQTAYGIPSTYTESQGALYFENLADKKEQSVITDIYKNVNDRVGDHKVTIVDTSPRKGRNLNKDWEEGKIGINPQKVPMSYELDGGDLVLLTDAYKTDGEKFGTEKQGELRINISDPSQKANFVAEQLKQGNAWGAYSVSPIAYGINHRVWNTESSFEDSPVQSVPIGDGVRVDVVHKTGNNYELRPMNADGSAMINDEGQPIIITETEQGEPIQGLNTVAREINRLTFSQLLNTKGKTETLRTISRNNWVR